MYNDNIKLPDSINQSDIYENKKAIINRAKELQIASLNHNDIYPMINQKGYLFGYCFSMKIEDSLIVYHAFMVKKNWSINKSHLLPISISNMRKEIEEKIFDEIRKDFPELDSKILEKAKLKREIENELRLLKSQFEKIVSDRLNEKKRLLSEQTGIEPEKFPIENVMRWKSDIEREEKELFNKRELELKAML